MTLMQKFTIAQAMVSGVEDFSKRLKQARTRGPVTLHVFIELCHDVAVDSMAAGGLYDHELFSSTQRGPRKSKQLDIEDKTDA